MDEARPETPTGRAGLSEAEAQNRLKSEGYNELAQSRRRSPFKIIAEVVREPMLALLIAGGLIYLLLGDRAEAMMLLAFACLSVVITVVQESRSERVLEKLRDLTSPRALVIREGVRKRIAGREVVRGDIVILSEGDRTPADASLLEASHLEADESLLTGESVPVAKGPDDKRVFSGSLIVRGSGVAVVEATGAASEIGKIGASLRVLEFEPPRMQAEMRRLVRVFGAVGISASLAAIALYGLLRGGWLDALLAGIALGMSMLPEEFPVVLTVFMAMGAWRISRARVLTRKAAAIETLGAATVLCTDKTGTLTRNEMSVAALMTPDGRVFSGDDICRDEIIPVIAAAANASAPDPFDPMEKAFLRLSEKTAARPERMTLLKTYGLTPELLAVTQVWEDADGALRVAAKGAPEAVLGLCGVRGEESRALLAKADGMAAQGYRVLAIATAEHTGETPPTPAGFDFTFRGFAGLADPIRETAAAAVAECRAAGVRVIMITGDYPATAAAIAEQAGIDGARIVTGDMLASMDDAALADAVRTANVFARIKPEQKLRIVEALKADGEIVAMTGDGVNDAPALKASHIGIAMGGRGTDVARESSAIVLLDDDFRAIVTTLRLGRRIYDNLRKATGFILSVHVPIAGMALLPLLTGMPIIFGPVHIAFLEMVIDPVCSLVLEAEKEEKDIMQRPPRPPAEPLLTRRLAFWSLFEGAFAFAVAAAVYATAISFGYSDDAVRTITFISVVSTIFSLILVNRTSIASVTRAIFSPNFPLGIVSLFVAIVLSSTLLAGSVRTLFDFAEIGWIEVMLGCLAGVACLGVLEAIKFAAGRPARLRR